MSCRVGAQSLNKHIIFAKLGHMDLPVAMSMMVTGRIRGRAASERSTKRSTSLLEKIRLNR